MKKRCGVCTGFAAILLAAIFILPLAGCNNPAGSNAGGTRLWWPKGAPDNGSNPGGSNGSISNITYYFIDDSWTRQSDGSFRTPSTIHNGSTTCQVSFNSTSSDSNTTLVINLTLQADSHRSDYIAVGYLDSSISSYGYREALQNYETSYSNSKRVEIPVYSSGSHFIEITFVLGSSSGGSSYASFKISN